MCPVRVRAVCVCWGMDGDPNGIDPFRQLCHYYYNTTACSTVYSTDSKGGGLKHSSVVIIK